MTGRFVRWILATSLLPAATFATDPPVTSLDFTTNLEQFVSGSHAGARIHSAADQSVLQTVDADVDHVVDVAFNNTGDRLAIAGGDPDEFGVVELFSWPGDTRQLRFDDHNDVVMDVAFDESDRFLFTASMDGLAKQVDIRTGKELKTFAGHSKGLTAVVYLPVSRHLLTGSLDQSIRVWDSQSGKLVRTLNNHTRPVTALALRPAGDVGALPMVASAGTDRTVRFWQPTIGRMVRFVRLPVSAQALVWMPDGSQLLAACRDGQLRIVDPVSLDVTEIVVSETPEWLYCVEVHKSTRSAFLGGTSGQVFRVDSVDGR